MGNFVLHPGDVIRSIAGGGAGLGDPLVRAPELVAADVQAGFITPEHADRAYGVIVRADGTLDPQATDRRRIELRSARIGKPPTSQGVEPEVPGLSVVLSDEQQGRSWSCGYCAHAIAPVAADWREHLVRRELPIDELFDQLQMRVRTRAAPPHISVLQYYCPSCASCLATDVLTDRTQPSSPSLSAEPALVDLAR